jgi:hypothetical protein
MTLLNAGQSAVWDLSPASASPRSRRTSFSVRRGVAEAVGLPAGVLYPSDSIEDLLQLGCEERSGQDDGGAERIFRVPTGRDKLRRRGGTRNSDG